MDHRDSAGYSLFVAFVPANVILPSNACANGAVPGPLRYARRGGGAEQGPVRDEMYVSFGRPKPPHLPLDPNRQRSRTGIQLSANKRMTRPVRGFGPNEVDFRGTRRPSEATSYT